MMPFEWSELTKMGGDPIGRREVNRLRKVLRDPARNWADARSIIVAGTLSTMGQTLWQCVEAVTMSRWPDGRPAPDAEQVMLALCYACGRPYPGRGRWSL